MKSSKNKDRNKRQTPIMDGDARPDKTIEPDPAVLKHDKKNKADEDKVTTERAGDVNSLEDYKDAK